MGGVSPHVGSNLYKKYKQKKTSPCMPTSRELGSSQMGIRPAAHFLGDLGPQMTYPRASLPPLPLLSEH